MIFFEVIRLYIGWSS